MSIYEFSLTWPGVPQRSQWSSLNAVKRPLPPGKRPEKCRFEHSPFFWSRYDTLEAAVASEVEAGENWRQVTNDVVSVFDSLHLVHFPSGATLMASLLFGSLHALLSPTKLYTPMSGTMTWVLGEQEDVLPQVASLLTSRDLEEGGRGWTLCVNASATAHLVGTI